jgi:hypothetical protein
MNLGTLDGGRWSTPHPGRLYPRKDPVPIVQEAGWASEPVWIGAENLAPTEIRSPDLPARSESVYRLRHPDSFLRNIICKNNYFRLIFSKKLSYVGLACASQQVTRYQPMPRNIPEERRPQLTVTEATVIALAFQFSRSHSMATNANMSFVISASTLVLVMMTYVLRSSAGLYLFCGFP